MNDSYDNDPATSFCRRDFNPVPQPHRSLALTLPLAAAGAALALLLAACASPQSLTPGASRDEVLARLGRPLAEYDLAEPKDGKRLEYLIGPNQQTVWMVDLDAQGRLLRSQQVHTAEKFYALRKGIDTMADVRREVGMPWLVQHYRLGNCTAWHYPYVEDKLWNSMMTVCFDDKGLVRSVESGPDPRFLGGNDSGRL